MFTLSLAALIVGPDCSDFSVFVDDGDAVILVPSTEDCGAGVPSRSLLVESLSDVAGVPFCIWFSVSLSSSEWSNISASSESVRTSVPSPRRMIRPPLPPKPLDLLSKSNSYSSGLSLSNW